MKISRKLRHAGLLVASLGLIAGLASCGGGGGSDNGSVTPPVAASNTPPASASASVDGFIAFMKTLVVTRDDTGAGLDVSAFVAPTSETADPDASVAAL